MSSNIRFLLNRTLGVRSSWMASSQNSMTIVPTRTLVKDIYAYTNKKKRMEARQERSLAWAKPLLDRREAEMKKETEVVTEDKEPHMLHLVYLIKTTQCRPWWEKQIAERLKLEGKLHQPVILKNTPYVNKLLNEIKHLVRIQPLTFPNGPPQNEADWEHTRINSRGEMIVVQRLKEYEPPAEAALPDPASEKWQLDKETVKKDLAEKIRSYQVHTEYFKTKYTYRMNQDGKEYRYTFNKDVPKYNW